MFYLINHILHEEPAEPPVCGCPAIFSAPTEAEVQKFMESLPGWTMANFEIYELKQEQPPMEGMEKINGRWAFVCSKKSMERNRYGS